jgi:thioredoxin reductase (NADPH)
VYYGAAHTEAANYQDKHVVVIGGANSAAQGMLFLSRYASRVSVCIRGDSPDWSQYLDTAIRANDKIEILTHTELVGIRGDQAIEGVDLKNNQTNETHSLPAEGIFVFIGQKPQSDFVADLVMRTERGHILTGLDLTRGGSRPPNWHLDRDPFILETNIPGVFAAGDVRNGIKHGVASATGDGDTAVSLFWEYLSTI